MDAEWAGIYRELSATSAAVQAVKAALETQQLTREEVKAIAAAAAAEIEAEGTPIPSVDEMRETIEKKRKHARRKWWDVIEGSDDQRVWAKATDEYRADIRNVLRLIRSVNRGDLPDAWHKLWADNQTAG